MNVSLQKIVCFQSNDEKKEKTVFIRVKKKKKNVLNYHKMGVWGDEKEVREKKKEKMRRQGENIRKY